MGKKAGGRVRIKQIGPKGPSAKDFVNPLDALKIAPEDMITLPPKMDSNTSHIWPLSETFSMKYERFSVVYPNYLDSNKTRGKKGRRLAQDDSVDRPTCYEIGEALQALRIRHVVQPYKGYPRDPTSSWDNPGRVMVDMDQYEQKGGGGKSSSSSSSSRVVEANPDGSYDVSGGTSHDEGGIPHMGGGGGGAMRGNDDDDDVDDGGATTGLKMKLLRDLARIIPHLETRKRRLAAEAAEKEAAEKKAKEVAAAASHRTASSSSSAANSSSSKKKGKKRR